MSDYSPACVCLQETMLGNTTPRSPTGYTLLRHPIIDDPIPGHGLAFLIHSSIAFRPLNINSTALVHAIQIQLETLITICNIYISPNDNITEELITNITQQLPEPYLLLGDFNAKHQLWGNDRSDARGRIIDDFITNHDAVLLNTGLRTHFHVQSGTESAIDLSICSPDLVAEASWDPVDDLYGSDHFPIKLTINNNDTLPERPIRFNTKKADWGSYCTASEFNPNNVDMNVHDRYKRFIDHIYQAAEDNIPKTSGKTKVRSVPWWSAECAKLIAERKQCLRRYQRSKLPVDKILYKHARARAQYYIRKAKRTSWKNFISEININTPMSKIWNKIRKIRGRQTINHPPILMHNNQLITNEPQISQILGEHYKSISSNASYPENFNIIRQRVEGTALNFNTNQETEYNLPITLDEITKALKTCNNSAPGEDLVTYSMIKNLHPSCLQELVNIINIFWTQHEYPEEWKRAIVLSFIKPGKDPKQTSSYRPIALTSSICKLVEKVVNVRLVRTLEDSDIISNQQFGFRKHRSTIDALTRLQTHILDSFNRSEHTVAIFFDIQKAYDTAWKHHILQNIHQAGIRGNLAYFVQNFLSGRKFKSLIGSSYSSELPQEQGVPQGSVVSCTLFLLAVNDMLNNLPPDVKAHLYVDDLVIYSSSLNINSIERRLQTAINNIQRWADAHGIVFSPQKTAAVHFHRRRGLQHEPSLFLYNNPIIFRTSTKYLGVIFDQRLRWKDHIVDLKTRCTSALSILKCLSRTSWGGDRIMLLRLYRSLIRSKLDYASFIYWTASNNILKKLDPVHNSAIRLCIGAFKSSPIQSLYAESGEMSLAHRRTQLALQYYARVGQTPMSPVYDLIFNHRQRHDKPDTHTLAELINPLIQNIEISISPTVHSNDPIWVLTDLMCKDFNPPPKKDSNPQLLKNLFCSHIEEKHSGTKH